MKLCRKCLEQKDESEFYRDTRYKEGNRLISHCKNCVLKRQKKREQIKYPVQMEGTKKCQECKAVKNILLFSVNRVRKTGREHLCKDCHSLNKRTKRRKKAKIYFRDDQAHLEADYHTTNCEICNVKFCMRTHTQQRCPTCGPIARSIHSSLIGTRRGVRADKCTHASIVDITKRYITAIECCYCKQEFTNDNIKSIDHAIPFIRGGSNKPDNINICCLICNLSKRDLDLDVWFDLCRRVAENNKKE